MQGVPLAVASNAETSSALSKSLGARALVLASTAWGLSALTGLTARVAGDIAGGIAIYVMVVVGFVLCTAALCYAREARRSDGGKMPLRYDFPAIILAALGYFHIGYFLIAP